MYHRVQSSLAARLLPGVSTTLALAAHNTRAWLRSRSACRQPDHRSKPSSHRACSIPVMQYGRACQLVIENLEPLTPANGGAPRPSVRLHWPLDLEVEQVRGDLGQPVWRHRQQVLHLVPAAGVLLRLQPALLSVPACLGGCAKLSARSPQFRESTRLSSMTRQRPEGTSSTSDLAPTW